MSAGIGGTRVRGVSGDTAAAIRLTLGRRDGTAVVAAVTVGYLLAFLWATGDLSVRPDVSPALRVVDDPIGRALARTGPASYGAVAIVDTGVVRLLFSPLNVALGALVAGLVGLNAGVTYLAMRQPAACGLGAGSGLFASVPALLSGTVCCGPVVLLAVGLQATATVLTVFAWLLPVGVALLLFSLVAVARRIRPAHGEKA